ncbi:MAG: sulfatase-like hydrolase/transferase [Thermoplasmata archaeon]
METHEPYPDGGLGSARSLASGFIPSSNYSYHSRIVSSYCTDTSLLHAAYANAITRADARIRELFGVLERESLLESSTIVILGDHGQCLGEHNFLGHSRFLYDELIHVPCLIWSKELANSREQGPGPREFLDHRHIFELISGLIESGADPTVFEQTLERSSLKLGPAVSFYRGRPFRPNSILARGPEYWLLRVISTAGSFETGTLGEPPSRTHETNLRNPAELVTDWTERTIRAIHRSTSPVYDDAAVSNRLMDWGYG